ncbi:MAG: flavodoxin domain-containing protein [Chloroflexales bacterium]
MATVLILYHTTYGHTAKVAEHIAHTMERCGHRVTLCAVTAHPPVAAMAAFDAIILGSPVYQNRHWRTIQAFARRHRKLLNRTLSAFFSVSGVAASQRPEDHVVARKAVTRLCVATGWYPPQVAIIAGAIPYTRYPPLTRLLMRWFMARQGSDTDTRRDYVYTDWPAVTAFADGVVRNLEAVPLGGPQHT